MAKGRNHGLFITLEGGEGSGKSTQAKLLADRLGAKGYTVVLTREPGGTEVGQWFRRLLEAQVELEPLAELLLFQAARAQHVAQLIRPALERGDIVVCDRFADSSLAYQGYGRGLDLVLIRILNHVACQGLVPDLTILLDLPPAVALARPDQTKAPDRIGSESLEFHQRVRDGYLTLADEQPPRFLVVDATLPLRRIAAIIDHRLRPLLPTR